MPNARTVKKPLELQHLVNDNSSIPGRLFNAAEANGSPAETGTRAWGMEQWMGGLQIDWMDGERQ